jgi:hypothetical protein
MTVAFLALVLVTFGATAWRLRAAGDLSDAATGPAEGIYRLDVVVPWATRVALRIAASPLVWLAVAGAVALAVIESRPAYPRALIGGWTLPPSVGLFAAAYVTAGRRPQAAAPASDERSRTAALLLGAAAAAVALGLLSLVVVVSLVEPLDVFGGWRGHPLELAQVVAGPFVMAMIAIAAARWWPHPAAALLVLLVLLVTPVNWELDLYRVTGRAGWEPADNSSLATSELAWHFVFLTGFSVLAAGLALLRHDHRLRLVAVTAVGAAALIVGQLEPGR